VLIKRVTGTEISTNMSLFYYGLHIQKRCVTGKKLIIFILFFFFDGLGLLLNIIRNLDPKEPNRTFHSIPATENNELTNFLNESFSLSCFQFFGKLDNAQKSSLLSSYPYRPYVIQFIHDTHIIM
jgi:hypothetical protein